MAVITSDNDPFSCPGCPEWEYHEDPDFKGIGQGTWKIGERTYGHVSKDAPHIIRTKCLFLSLGFIPVVAIRMAYRTCTLLTGDFIRAGCEKANAEWQLKSQEWSISEDHTKPLPSRSLIVAKHVLMQLIKNVIKIATYPIALIGLVCASLYGIIDPINGRRMIAAIEHAWSRDTVACSVTYGEYLAVCMQPKDVWDQKNIYQGAAHYHPQFLRNLLREIDQTLKEKQQFFENETLDVKALLGKIDTYRQNIRIVSPTTESDATSAKRSNLQTESYTQSQQHLQEILKTLKAIETDRTTLVSQGTQQRLISKIAYYQGKLADQIQKLTPFFA